MSKTSKYKFIIVGFFVIFLIFYLSYLYIPAVPQVNIHALIAILFSIPLFYIGIRSFTWKSSLERNLLKAILVTIFLFLILAFEKQLYTKVEVPDWIPLLNSRGVN